MRLYTIDIIRAVSALLILLFHYTFRYAEISSESNNVFFEWPIQIWWGYGCISSFFILSGFLSSHLLTNGGGKSYFIRRILRLYPTFWICVIISALILSNLGDRLISLKTFLLNLTMIPGCFHINYVDGAYWTMQMELFFTLIMTFILLLKKLSLRITAIIGWAIISLMFNLLSPNIDNVVLRLIRIITMPEYAPAFIGGISIYQILYIKEHRATFSIPLIISVVSSYFANSISSLFFLLVITLIILSVIKQLEIQLSKHPKAMSFFAYFAAISYPLYLIHQYVGYVIIDNVRIQGFENEIIIVIPIIASIIIATIIHYCFENKLNRIERKKLNFFKF